MVWNAQVFPRTVEAVKPGAAAGSNSIRFLENNRLIRDANGHPAGSGVYLYRLSTGITC